MPSAVANIPVLSRSIETDAREPMAPTLQDERALSAASRSAHETTLVQCPVCNRPVRAPGRIRHQQCENRAPARSIAEADLVGKPSFVTDEYRRLVAKAEHREKSMHGQRREVISRDPIRYSAARQAVLLRSSGRCENPSCGGQPADVTDDGQAILEVDHIERIAEGGRDHPKQMIALCPNCHAMKERGRNRDTLQAALAVTADRLHGLWSGDRP
ncbi:HNH endonuclease [Streptomyces vastus]